MAVEISPVANRQTVPDIEQVQLPMQRRGLLPLVVELEQDLGRSGFVGEVSLRSPQANGSFYAIPSGDDQPPSANPQFPLSHPFDAVKL
jgi:hypothetical protein